MEWVAHRGYAAKYPENTLAAMEAAVRAGVRWLECDIQLSADGQPLLIHDATTARCCGEDLNVMTTPWSQLSGLRAAESPRFGGQFDDEPLPLLADLVAWLAQWPQVSVFVELKEESLEHFGRAHVLDCVLPVLAPVAERCCLISFDYEVLQEARARKLSPLGWVLHEVSADSRRRAEALTPELLICNHRKFHSPGALWPGPWTWFLYEFDTLANAQPWADAGVRYLESMRAPELLREQQRGS